MLVGIVSDTHGFYHPELDNAFQGVDHIFHAGDVGRVEILDRLESIAPLTAVWGNVDGREVRQATSEYQQITLDGVSFLMTHIAGRPGRMNSLVSREIVRFAPDVFICGHSHILQIQKTEIAGVKTLFINPGAAGRQGLHRVKTCVRLNIADGNLSEAEVIHLDGD